jgi:hypothetical protein
VSGYAGAGGVEGECSVQKDKLVRVSYFNRAVVAGVLVCAFVALLPGWFDHRFEIRWRNLKHGMTQPEVMQALGSPGITGKTETIGAGGKAVTRWEYKRGRCTYCVDFDYTGPGGAPQVYRTELFKEEWEWPDWFPWQPARARA